MSRRSSSTYATLVLGVALSIPAGGCVRTPPVFAFCVDGETRCSADAVETCAGGIWQAPASCGTGESCSLGECSDAATCRADCIMSGETACAGASVVTCGEFDSDGCLDLGMALDCDPGLTCSDGLCGTTCTDECTAGATGCAGPAATRACGDYDDDDCLDWGGAVPCPTTQSCVEATGTASCLPAANCTDDCSPVDFPWTCSGAGTGYTACVTDFDADPCYDSAVVLCSEGCTGTPLPLECKECCVP